MEVQGYHAGMYVYVISAGEQSQKVGIAKSPSSRLHSMRAITGMALAVVHMRRVSKALAVERLAHEKLKPHRTSGEWFSVRPEEAIRAVDEAVVELDAAEGDPGEEVNTSLLSRRKASADFHAKRKAEGWRKSTHWLSPEAQAALKALQAVGSVSADAALNQALIAAANAEAGRWGLDLPADDIAAVRAKVAEQYAAMQAMKPVVERAFKPRRKTR